MEPFTQLTGVAAPLPIINVDTDMIIPKQFLKTIKRTGLGSALFHEMRTHIDGTPNPDCQRLRKNVGLPPLQHRASAAITPSRS